MSEIILIMGFPSAGKSSLVENYPDHIRLNRDQLGGTIKGLAQRLEEEIKKGGTQFVLDNTYATALQRALFIAVGKKYSIPVKCVWLNTSIEDAQVNASTRMVRKYGHLLDREEISAKKDPNCFPPIVLFTYRKSFEKPSLAEGFSELKIVKFIRKKNKEYTNKALILDYDGTLRDTISGKKYPTSPDDIEILPNRREKLQEYVDAGFILAGVSNQSGVGKGVMTQDTCIATFQRTNELLGFEIDYRFCPYNYFPINCFCRKPMPGLGMQLVKTYKLDISESIFVGDATTDRTFAKRCGFRYFHPNDFFFKIKPNISCLV